MTDRLLSQLKEVKNKKAWDYNRCAVYRFLCTLDESERKDYEQIIDDREVLTTELSKVFFNNGIKLTSFMIRYHRNRAEGRGCQCPVK